MTPETFASAVLDWYAVFGRKDLPWQREPAPYPVWVSEIMLQQTQVAVVIPYFERFMTSFPDIGTLANAPVDAVLAHWSGLGYYARARNLHRAAQIVRDRHRGQFPSDFDQVVALPGIGRSTAGAILSLALGQHHPILDGNVKRVLTRCFGIDGWPGSSQILARLWTLAERCTPRNDTGFYNQGMMDLGATLCTRARPACERCPVASHCMARSQNRQHQLPTPRPAKKIPERTTQMLIAMRPTGEILLERRPPSGIWGGLWSLPETPEGRDPGDWSLSQLGQLPAKVEMRPSCRHTFSHYRLDIQVALIRLERGPDRIADDDGRCWRTPDEALNLGIPAPVKRILEELESQIGRS
ncbi:A/G-specific adenine glycosylase [Imhoffiella purpurea]|nr:A/G-specific adenine glycosylase [Imhoffiella purpurea]